MRCVRLTMKDVMRIPAQPGKQFNNVREVPNFIYFKYIPILFYPSLRTGIVK